MSKVRILHYATAGSVTCAAIQQQWRNHVCVLNVTTLNRILSSMVGMGWLKINAASPNGVRAERAYSITREGRRVLEVARRDLALLAEWWFAA
jgi:hypothetical protein